MAGATAEGLSERDKWAADEQSPVDVTSYLKPGCGRSGQSDFLKRGGRQALIDMLPIERLKE